MQTDEELTPNLPATCSVAFLLRATPQSFSASHQKVPASLSRRECTTWILRKIQKERGREKNTNTQKNRKSIALNTLTLKIHEHSLAIMTTKQNYTSCIFLAVVVVVILYSLHHLVWFTLYLLVCFSFFWSHWLCVSGSAHRAIKIHTTNWIGMRKVVKMDSLMYRTYQQSTTRMLA